MVASLPRGQDSVLYEIHGRLFLTREVQILQCLTLGMDNFEIAQYLHVNETTVGNYITRIGAKIGVDNVRKVVVWATTRRIALRTFPLPKNQRLGIFQ